MSLQTVEEQPKPGHWYAGMPSPNPGGRPRTPAELKQKLVKIGDLALDKVVDMMNTAKSETVQLMAAKELLDRAYGKPVSIQVQADTAELERMGRSELRAFIKDNYSPQLLELTAKDVTPPIDDAK